MDVATAAVHPIWRYSRAVLHRRAEPVTSFGADLAALVRDMFASMYAAGGAGLAANQIGVGLRVFVYDCPDATVTGLDLRGEPVTVTGTGVLARCLQHETDHLDGIVYVDRLPAGERAAVLAAAGLAT